MTMSVQLRREPFTTATSRAAGISDAHLRALVLAGEVRRVLRGVYVASSLADTTELRAAAARLVLNPTSVNCDRTAAWLWGVDTFAYRELEILPPLEAYVLRGRTRTRRLECRGGVRDLRPEDVVTLHALRVTSPLRTSVDLACKLSPKDALAALDGFMRHHGITHHQMRRLLVRYRRRRGVVQARALVPLADPRAESPGESWTRLELIERGLRPPELQWWFELGGRRIYRLDIAWPKHKVAVEYDGREFHEDDDRREHDRQRRELMRAHGWTIVVVTKNDFDLDSVDRWTGEVREALGAAYV